MIHDIGLPQILGQPVKRLITFLNKIILLKSNVLTSKTEFNHSTAKRGFLHGFKLGLYRLPIKFEDPNLFMMV